MSSDQRDRPDLESLATLQSIADNSPGIIMILARDGTIRFINRTAPGLTVDQVLGTKVFEHVPADQHNAMQACFDRVRQTGEPDNYFNVYDAPEGEKLYWESRVGLLPPDGFVVFSSDVTAQRAEQIEHERFFELSVDMLCVASLDGHFTRLSSAFERVLGYSQEQLLARPFFDFVHPDDIERTRDAVERLAAGHEVTNFENRYRRADGTFRWFEWYGRLDEESRAIHAVARDVTEQRRLQVENLHRKKMEAVGQLAGGVAHEFNNLMLSVLANSSFAKKLAPEGGELAEILKEIHSAGERATNLTHQLLSFSNRQSVSAAPLEIGAVVRQMTDMLRHLLPASIGIAIADFDGPTVAAVDRSQLEQIIVNLCLNARDAMPEGGRLELSVSAVDIDEQDCREQAWASPGPHVRLSVADGGEGIDPSALPRVFDPFFTTRDQGVGTGLGLSMVYATVQRHGGLIRVRSKLSEGTTVEIDFPATELPTGKSETTTSKNAEPGGGETILLAEDEELVRRVVVRILERAGYEVIAAKNGREAVELYRENATEVSLLVFDVVMPELGGVEAYEQIREIDPHVRALFSSGYNNILSSRPGPRLDLLEKPYEPQELLVRVRALLDEEA